MVRRDLGLDRRVFLKAVGLAGIAAAEPAFAQLFVNIQRRAKPISNRYPAFFRKQRST